MAEAKTKGEVEHPTFSGGVTSLVARTLYSDMVGHAAADIGSIYQACIYSGWHTQSAAIDSPEQIAEDAARTQVKDHVAPEHKAPKIGLEKD